MADRDRTKCCCFTGHRPEKLPWGEDESDPRCVALKERIFDAAEAVCGSGATHFICGMALGCDMYFGEAVVELRAQRPEVTLEAAIPCEEQALHWKKPQRDRYYRLLSECDFQTLVQREYTSDCMLRRNRYMVDSASVMIAVYDGSPGGTMQTMLYALRQKLEIIELSPLYAK